MSVKISTTNTKLGLIPSVNLPPIITCRENCPCIPDCYGNKGRFRYPNVKERHTNNLNEYIINPEEYFKGIKLSISNGTLTYNYFRWHAVGDIVDSEYFAGMVKLANELPQTSFLAFTKKYQIVNEFIERGGVIPDNLHIVFSAWGTDLQVVNPHNFPIAHVRFKDETKNINIPADAKECSGDCTNCLKCWSIGRGESVVFNKH